MKIYRNTEQERTLSDYITLPSLSKMSLHDLYELQSNIEQVEETAWLYGSDLLAIACDMDLKKVDTYIRMYERRQARQAVSR